MGQVAVNIFDHDLGGRLPWNLCRIKATLDMPVGQMIWNLRITWTRTVQPPPRFQQTLTAVLW